MHTPLLLPAIEPLLRWLDLAGIGVFAASGAIAATRKHLDIIAAGFFALVTAIGGGTVRDLLIDVPVFWMHDPAPVAICLVVAMFVWISPRAWWPERALEWFDAIGLAAYATFGAGKALHLGIPPLPATAMGVVTACIGGVIRDVVAGVPSILLRHELYVTAALLAAGLFVVLAAIGVERPWPALIGAVAGFALRGAALRWGWRLPGYAR